VVAGGWTLCMVILFAMPPLNPLAGVVLRVALAMVIVGLIVGAMVVCRKHQRPICRSLASTLLPAPHSNAAKLENRPGWRASHPWR
jgi:hypothetical protein